MKSINRTVKTIIGCAALAFLMIPSASADVWDKKTNVTFREPVEFPGGTVLAPGSYVLKLLNSATDRHIVQVYNQDQNHMLAMVMAIPTQRLEPAPKTIITFYEAPQNEPVLIHTWFYPGDTVGQEFTYPKGRVRYAQTAAVSTPPLVAETTITESETSRSTLTPPAETKTEETRVVEVKPAEIPRPTEVAQAPAEEPVLLAQAEPPKQAFPDTQPAPARDTTPSETLPSTASDSPWWAAGSILLMAGGFLLRAARLVRG